MGRFLLVKSFFLRKLFPVYHQDSVGNAFIADDDAGDDDDDDDNDDDGDDAGDDDDDDDDQLDCGAAFPLSC